MKNTNEIAAKFLGKDSLNNKMASYIAPENIDNSLLVAIPRSLNRESHGIDQNLFKGFDVWNCYELSTINAKGKPFVGIMKIFFPADSINIVESKSLKLYLNSFNLCKLKGVTKEDLIYELENIITKDLQLKIDEKNIKVKIYDVNIPNLIEIPISHCDFKNIDDLDIEIDQSSNHSLVIQHYEEVQTLRIHSALLRSNCRVTNQPDWGDVYIHIKGKKLPTEESLLRHITSMRKEQHFHEEISESIYHNIYTKFEPQELLVQCLYTRRGGIDINPIRYTKNIVNDKMLKYFSNENIYKTNRQ
ncbi:NADPH-dependent 7-cyano-7-deazaguanine reductase QueF [Francisella adeliensis]|uniref:NADPH-dependent 7-cyano-7-deazaguanine reductase QueF n=1 Tax=Francisella adeliensis TaxID=2007306 RepID=A0A2Z4XWP7_9GAMM|nr:NADPH-dependent 7-cyano-7-deazaguanine reductase QueF [Francisella adeliensis]AXA33038.1 hypothetical protein CDH04_00775 [Francisella adeliensis]MBK2086076.1 NADPH-dependent 7-cyano-7-deazaguanine reductase QueF [Francisella adeliensis]MBK2096760.1 NADPH-dependent 7-cyano-7-deazaguanine reductase QueF [Francisella adeliensis]QIW11264.1 NADPH-dependent 7-cyano-7-deazaguanine reductase QueF [Francisella adeliensis]QIW13140.1 NADPH-dependent 7-cyano-7-deazaguanine reductase QueF [Francisella 